MQRFLIPSILLAGLVLVGIGMNWNHIRPASSYWSKEQAAEYTAAQSALHGMAHNHGNVDEAHSAEYLAAKDRYTKITGDLQSAQNAQSRTGTVFMALGIMSVLAAIVLHYRGK